MTDTTETSSNLGLPDIINAVRIIDAAAERGAFKGNELSQVGAVRDKIAAFIEAATKAQKDAEGEGETVATEAPAPAPKAPAKGKRK